VNKRNTPCGFPQCPAFAVDGREHCPVHSPEKVLARAKQIVLTHLREASRLEEDTSLTTIDLLRKLKIDILTDLDQTV
jgi:hypothetical protein